MTTNDSSVSYDPFDVDINADPYPTFRRLRDEAPIYYNERYDFWALSRRSDVEKGLVDWQVFSSSRGDILEIIQSGMEAPSGVVLWEDPPLQALHRGLLSRVFTPKAMNALEDKVRGYCVKCLDPLVAPTGSTSSPTWAPSYPCGSSACCSEFPTPINRRSASAPTTFSGRSQGSP